MKLAATAIAFAALATAGLAQAHPSKPFGADAQMSRIADRAKVSRAASDASVPASVEVVRVSSTPLACRASSHKTPSTLVALQARACAELRIARRSVGQTLAGR